MSKGQEQRGAVVNSARLPNTGNSSRSRTALAPGCSSDWEPVKMLKNRNNLLTAYWFLVPGVTRQDWC